MEIRIHLPRPFLTIAIVVAVVLYATGVVTIHWPGSSLQDDAIGGEHPADVVTDARLDIDRQQVTQAVLAQREEILRYNLDVLERAALTTRSEEDIRKLNDARAVLLGIIKERDQSEKLLVLSLQQLWDAEGTAYRTQGVIGDRVLRWPVAPLLGLSATFEDTAYEKRFGFAHHAVDIPTNQGTEIRAPAGGVARKVSMNGLGYSYIVLEHDGELQTIYGHVTDATVQEGQTVTTGDIIGHTGGQPGTIGAGLMTTGPHLHFAIRKGGVLVDPMNYLPRIPSHLQSS